MEDIFGRVVETSNWIFCVSGHPIFIRKLYAWKFAKKINMYLFNLFFMCLFKLRWLLCIMNLWIAYTVFPLWIKSPRTPIGMHNNDTTRRCSIQTDIFIIIQFAAIQFVVYVFAFESYTPKGSYLLILLYKGILHMYIYPLRDCLTQNHFIGNLPETILP